MTRDIEELSAELHEVYMKEAARQGDVRHAEDYNELPERIKEFDRALARHIIAREKAILDEVFKEASKNIQECFPERPHYKQPERSAGIRIGLVQAIRQLDKTINRLRGK